MTDPAPTATVVNNLPEQPFRELPPVVRETLTGRLADFEHSAQSWRGQQDQWQRHADEAKTAAEAAERQAHQLRVYLAGGDQ